MSINRGVNKMWYIHMTKYYTAAKKDDYYVYVHKCINYKNQMAISPKYNLKIFLKRYTLTSFI